MQPSVTPAKPLQVKKFPRQRHFLAAFFISFFWGTFGVDRMYLGKYGTGILKLVTFGGFGVWTIVDLYLVLAGLMRDKQGREMLQYAEYKKFAYKVILFSALALGVAVLVGGISLILSMMQLIDMLQNGGGPDLLQTIQNSGLPGASGLPTAGPYELGM